MNTLNYIGSKKTLSDTIVSVVSSEIPELTAKSFMEDGKYISKTYDLHTCKLTPSNSHPYIVKDATSFGQKGVHIITKEEQLEHYKQKLRHTYAIVSEYMTNPLLWRGKKFHFRIYVGVYISDKKRFVKVFTQSNYAFKIFMAKDQFVPDQYSNDDIHITGRKSTTKRHQWPIMGTSGEGRYGSDLDNEDFYFPEEDLPNGMSFSDITDNIDKMFEEVITPHLDKFEKYHECDAGFEIFGADVMLNDQGEPIILEINAKIGYSEDYGEANGAKEYHQHFSKDLFNWICDNFILV